MNNSNEFASVVCKVSDTTDISFVKFPTIFLSGQIYQNMHHTMASQVLLVQLEKKDPSSLNERNLRKRAMLLQYTENIITHQLKMTTVAKPQ